MEKKPLTGLAKNLYGISDFGFTFMANIENYFLMFFLTNVAKLPLAGISAATSLAYAADSIGQPIYAGLISALKPMRWGKNRSYIVIYAPMVVITFVLTFSNLGPPTVALFICGLMLFLTNMTRTFTWTSNLNLITVLSQGDADNRMVLASRRATWTSAAGIFYSYGVLPLLRQLITMMDEAVAYTTVAAITSIFYMLMCYVTIASTRGYEATGADAKAEGQRSSQQVGLVDILKSAVQNPYLLVILGGAVITSSFNTMATSATTYYYTYIGNPSLFSLQLLLASIVTTISSYLSAPVGKRLGAKRTVLVGYFGTVILNVLAYMVALQSTPLLIACLTIRGMFMGINRTSMVALYGDCVVYARWKTGKDTSAFVMGSQTIPIKIGLTLRGILVPLTLALVKFDPRIPASEATMELKRGIVTMLVGLPAIGTFLTALVFLFFFRLTKERVAELQKEINEREAAEVNS